MDQRAPGLEGLQPTPAKGQHTQQWQTEPAAQCDHLRHRVIGGQPLDYRIHHRKPGDAREH